MSPIFVNILLMVVSIFSFGVVFLSWNIIQLKKKIDSAERHDFTIANEAVERDRKRIAADLHDEAGLLLSLLSFDVDFIMKEISSLSADGVEKLYKVGQNLKLLNEGIRINIWNISALRFEDADLAQLLLEVCQKLKGYKGIAIIFANNGLVFPVSPEQKLHLFRVVQELLMNAVKYSSAKNMSVLLHWGSSHHLFIAIENDGKRYNPVEKANSDGIGELNIANRLKYVGATIKHQALEEGQSVTIELKVLQE